MEPSALALGLDFLSVLRPVASHPLVAGWREALGALDHGPAAFARAYGTLCEAVYRAGDPGAALLRAIHCSDNVLTACCDAPSTEVLHAASHDVSVLQELIATDGRSLLAAAAARFPVGVLADLPDFPAGTPLPFADGAQLAAFYRENGFGAFAEATFFTVIDGTLLPVANPDPVQLFDLKGYTRQKEQILTNTRAFLHDRPYNNILLYGDKGTGKSSTVKAIVNAFASEGLKIIELPTAQLHTFPALCAQAAASPYHIIVFLDDLSFDREDDNFAVLKAFIEGGLTGKPQNMAIYATSNRRHLVRENFSDRQGDEVHLRDTLETITSLSDRFGLEITFSSPDKDEYLMIVDALAEETGIDLPQNELHLLAERFAIRRNGRSPRTARQFIQAQLAQHME